MKKFAILTALVFSALLASGAAASVKALAKQLIDAAYAGGQEVAPPGPRAENPAAREAHYRRIAAAFYAKKFNEEELTDLIGFYRSAPAARFLKSQGKLEKEVLLVAFTTLLEPAKPTESVAPVDPDERRELAEQLFDTPIFRQRIAGHAANLDKLRAVTPESQGQPLADSAEGIRAVYVDRYAKRFSKRVLIELVAFHKSKIGLKYAASIAELQEHLKAQPTNYE